MLDANCKVGCGTFRGETVGKARPGRLRSAFDALAGTTNKRRLQTQNRSFLLMPNSTPKVKGEFWASPPHIRITLTIYWSFLFCLYKKHMFVYNDYEVSDMAIRDCGKRNGSLRLVCRKLIGTARFMDDQERMIIKPIIDVYESEEFDKRICYAMEYNLSVKITIWYNGFIFIEPAASNIVPSRD